MTGIMRIFNILFGLCFLFNISLGFSTTLDEANDAYDSKNYIKSLYLYDTVLYEEPGNLDAIYWAAMAAEAEGMFDRRVGYLQMLKKEDSNGIIPRAMLIHSYQVLSEKKKEMKSMNNLLNYGKN